MNRSSDTASWTISAIVCVVVTCGFVGSSPRFWHWFVIPVALSSILIVKDAIDWFRARTDAFDPTGLVGVYGVHYFLLAPLLHVAWDHWQKDRFAPLDWRTWLGWMAVVGLVGLIGYRLGHKVTLAHVPPLRTLWRINSRRALIVMPAMLSLTALAQLWIYWRFGGIRGFVYAHDVGASSYGNPFQGLGSLFTISESFPMLFSLSYIMIARRRPAWRSLAAICAVVLVQFGAELIFGGLRGSRNNVVVGMFWTICLIHLFVRPLGRKHILVGLLSMILFMNISYYYKHGGADAFINVLDPGTRQRVTRLKGIGDEREFIVLRDFARSDIQALALYILSTSDDYRLALGRSYVGAMTVWVPKRLWPDRPETVLKERTELFYGHRSPVAYADFKVPIIFGAPGEAMLNFGRWSAPIPFLLWGVFVGWVTALYRTTSRDDARSMMLPLLILFSVLVFIADSHNLVIFLTHDGVIPLFALWLISDKVVLSPKTGPKQADEIQVGSATAERESE